MAERPRGNSVGVGRLLGLRKAERTGQGEDGNTELAGENGTSRVRTAVAQAVDLVDDGDVGVPEGEEVRLCLGLAPVGVAAEEGRT